MSGPSTRFCLATPPMPRHRVAEVTEISLGSLFRAALPGRTVCVAHAEDGNLYAIDDACTHECASLSEGDLLGFEVECPLHFSRFDLRTGAVSSLPALEPAVTYPVEVEDGAVFVLTPELG